MLSKALVSSVILAAGVSFGITHGMTEPHPADAAPSALRTLRVDHVMVNVSDFDRSVAWYRDTLGFTPQVTWTVDGLDGTRLAYLERDGFMIEIASGPATDRTAALPRPSDFSEHFAQRGFTHLCFIVEDVDAALAELGRMGVPTFSPAIDFPALGVRVGFIQDPDGNVIELKGPLAGRDALGGEATWHAGRGRGSSHIAADPGVDAADSAIRANLERWRDLWSQTGRGERFTFAGSEDLFDTQGENLLVFDSYVPSWATTQVVGFDDYRMIWEHDVNASFPGWTITRMDIVSVETAASGDLAWSAVNFWGEGVRPDGTTYEGSQHGTHVWRLIDGRWRIIHEHLTAPITVRGEVNGKIDGPADTVPGAPR